MKPRPEELQRVARAVVRELGKQKFFHITGDEPTMIRRVIELIQETFDQEQALEREAERLAERHAGQMRDMDTRKIIQGIKARLAEERKFPL
ncbi:MAG TPA: DUF507 family protein [Terriglobales bacterium]|nr:DUF507 family protein [Terriglobales bacterium]